MTLKEKVEISLNKVKKRLENSDFYGYEMFDGLNSPLFENLIFNNSKFLRLCITQLFKRSPINLRPLLGVKGTQDVKGLALSLMAYVNLGDKEKCDYLYNLILKKQINNDFLWGYTWSYQLLAHYAKKNDPNVIATLFVLNAFLDFYEKSPTSDLENVINKTSESLYKSFYLPDKKYFSYFLNTDFGVYNAIALSSYVLARRDKVFNENKYSEASYNGINYIISKQNPNGSWFYGDLKNHNFIDHFHTIYNLQSLNYFINVLGYKEVESSYKKGNEYYTNNLFRGDGLPKLYHNKNYPLDIHCLASAIIYLTETKQKNDYLEKILNYAIDEMQLESGDFIFRVCSFYKNKNVYVRWSNAWMFYALSAYLKASK